MKRYTEEEARAWMESRVWANGLELKADDTIDAVEFAEQYSANPELWDALFAWLKNTDLTESRLANMTSCRDAFG